jgi:hypothetical protein
MAKVQEIPCKSWNEFKSMVVIELFGDKPFQKSRFLFRGQVDPDWQLTSSYDRWFDSQALQEDRRIEMAGKLLDSFRREARTAGQDSFLDGMPDEHIMAIAQHYGLPTRLLDWSESPYIASFFAFADVIILGMRPTSVTVWALDTTSFCWDKDRGTEIITIASPRSNVRLRNQEGKFTLLRTPSKCLEQHLEPFNIAYSAEQPLRRFLIPSRDTAAALSELDAMGINASRAYYDLHGFAMAARIHHQLRILAEK